MVGKNNHFTGIGEILWDMFPDGAQFGGGAGELRSVIPKRLAHNRISLAALEMTNWDSGRWRFCKRTGVDTSNDQPI